jgi:hypothetical protein
MKTEGNTPAYGVGTDNYHVEVLSKRELMAIEFTKTLLGLRHYDNQPIYELRNNKYQPDNEMCQFNSQEQADIARKEEVDALTEKALYVADNLIEALNKEEQ